MNWMTSGRKRVQRSQKGREQRAKHFAKVTADRRMHPQPFVRRVNGTGPSQSSDVARLKSRWTVVDQQSCQPGGSSSQSTIAGVTAQPCAPQSSPSYLDSARSNTATTTEAKAMPEGAISCGVLDLEITPPRRRVPLPRDNVAMGEGVAIGSYRPRKIDVPAFVTTALQDQPPRPSRVPSPPACPRPPLRVEGRHQQVFGGGREEGRRDLGEAFHNRFSAEGGDIDGGTSMQGLTTHRGDASVSAAGRPSPASRWRGFDEEMASGQLRFFNSGVEVAADGSPVHDNSVHGVPVPHREAIDTTEQPPEVRSSALNDPSLPGIMVAPPGLGFARFGGGVFRCRPHPSGSPNTQKPGNLRDADFQRESRMHQPSFMDSPIKSSLLPADHWTAPAADCESMRFIADDTLHDFQTAGPNILAADTSLDGTPREKRPRTPSTGVHAELDTYGAVFTTLARTWGLFGGALENTSKVEPTPPLCAGTTTVTATRAGVVSEAHENAAGLPASKAYSDTLAPNDQATGNGSSDLVEALSSPVRPSKQGRPLTSDSHMSELLSEVDRAASGSESPELVMYWHKKTVVDHDMAASDLQTRIEATPRCATPPSSKIVKLSSAKRRDLLAVANGFGLIPVVRTGGSSPGSVQDTQNRQRSRSSGNLAGAAGATARDVEAAPGVGAALTEIGSAGDIHVEGRPNDGEGCSRNDQWHSEICTPDKCMSVVSPAVDHTLEPDSTRSSRFAPESHLKPLQPASTCAEKKDTHMHGILSAHQAHNLGEDTPSSSDTRRFGTPAQSRTSQKKMRVLKVSNELLTSVRKESAIVGGDTDVVAKPLDARDVAPRKRESLTARRRTSVAEKTASAGETSSDIFVSRTSRKDVVESISPSRVRGACIQDAPNMHVWEKAYSTVVWYKTIVACLVAADRDHCSSVRQKRAGSF